MGYYSDIYLSLSKKGFEKLKEFNNNYLISKNKDVSKWSLFNYVTNLEEIDDNIIIGWNCLKWYDGYTDVDSIMLGLDYLKEINHSFDFIREGESDDDIERITSYNPDEPIYRFKLKFEVDLEKS